MVTRHHTHSDKFIYKCSKRRKLAALCGNKSSYEYNEVMDSVFSVIRQHMNLCIEKTKFVQKMNSRKENVLQYDIYTKQIAKLQNDVRRITANKSGLYEDYREQLITAEELCQYQKEYESRVNEIEARTRSLRRTDVIVDYRGEQFIIELKIWRGQEYNSRGEKQLADYLDYYHQKVGYMISFAFNKNKKSGVYEVKLDDKIIIEAIV